MNHRLRIVFNVLLAVVMALITSGEQPSLAEGTIIYVDADATGANNGTSWADAFTTLQPALGAAVSGDQIWVAEGTYTPTVVHGGKSRRFRSFQLENGVAIFGGFDPSTGAVAWDDRDWVSYSTILSGDLKGDDGLDFANNRDNSYHIFYHPVELGLNATAILDGFTIRGGNANHYDYPHNVGGGMYNVGASPALVNCTFTGNQANDGAGIYNITSSAPVLTGVTFAENAAAWAGGGMQNYGSSPTLNDCIFQGNSAGISGGGINNSDLSSPIVTNTIFWGNTAENGGGMHNYYSYPVLTNCTFAGNTATYGGAILNYAGANPVLINCILWGNTPDQFSGDAATVTYSDVEGGYTGTGNINADPLFVDPPNGDFHLSASSPAIDMGNNNAAYLPLFDFEGEARNLDGNGDGAVIVDMGVDEFYYVPPPQVIIYVDQDATGANNGTSWADAFTTLQPALESAVSNAQIWVAAGTYLPSDEFTAGDPRSVSFQMKNGVAIYGGFTGSESSLDERDWVNNETILSCDLNGDDGPDFTNNAENCYHVFYHPSNTALDNSAILDGFTIRGGNANGGSAHNSGAGMYNNGSSPYLNNCIFSGNSAFDSGGGMLNNYSSPILTNCSFLKNLALGNGGGGIFNGDSSPFLTNCTFVGNTAVNYGGGMYNTGMFTSLVLVNCVFSDNSADKGGGIASLYYPRTELTNCTFVGNIANYGGGLYSEWLDRILLTNSILWGDSPNEIYDADTYYDPDVTYSDIQGGYNGTGNINTDPFFVDPLNGDFHLSASSPTIDKGNNNATYLPLFDFEGDSRVLDGNGDGIAIVDMGADETVYVPQPPAIILVDQDALGANNGTSWTDAFITLQPALETAKNGDQIWVAEGTYLPTREFTSGDPRSVSFQMRNGVAIYGGFAGTESSVEERDWETNLTFLSGDIGIPDVIADNSYHVFYHPTGTNLDNSAVLDGFVITGGNSSEGGGMSNTQSSPALANCTFKGNLAEFAGGGMRNSYSSPILMNVTFSGNSAGYYGGGIFNYNSSPTLTNCIFSGNSVSNYGGGGMANDAFSSPIITNCTFSGNSAGYGGAVHNNISSPVYTNCILWGDTPNEITSDYEFGNPIVTYSDVQGGHVGEGNLDLDPLFVDAANGDFHLSAGSPVIDMGSNASVTVDFEGDPRILDGNGDGVAIVDMGADEYNPESLARSGGAFKLNTGQQPEEVGLAQLSWQPVAILAIGGFYAVMPEHVRKYSTRNFPR